MRVNSACRFALAFSLAVWAWQPSPCSAQTPIIQSDLIYEGSGAANRLRELKRAGMPAIQKRLKAPISFAGVDRPATTLAEVLNDLGTKADVCFSIDDRAFRAGGLPDVVSTCVAAKTPVPAMDGRPLEQVLQEVLARLPSSSKAVFINRGDEIEITTHHTALVKDWRELCARVRELSLEVKWAVREALDDLSKK
jgi:hypothetical protein